MVGFLCASSQQLLPCNALTGLQPQDPRFPETCQTKLILTGGYTLHTWLHPINIPLLHMSLTNPCPRGTQSPTAVQTENGIDCDEETL